MYFIYLIVIPNNHLLIDANYMLLINARVDLTIYQTDIYVGLILIVSFRIAKTMNLNYFVLSISKRLHNILGEISITNDNITLRIDYFKSLNYEPHTVYASPYSNPIISLRQVVDMFVLIFDTACLTYLTIYFMNKKILKCVCRLTISMVAPEII